VAAGPDPPGLPPWSHPVIDFLGLFPGGPSRRRLLCGQEVTTRQLMEMISFEGGGGGGGGGKYQQQPEVIRRVIGELRDEEAQLFFRTATGEGRLSR